MGDRVFEECGLLSSRSMSGMLELLAGGMSDQEILSDYPYLEPEDIQACLHYAAKLASYHAEPIQ